MMEADLTLQLWPHNLNRYAGEAGSGREGVRRSQPSPQLSPTPRHPDLDPERLSPTPRHHPDLDPYMHVHVQLQLHVRMQVHMQMHT